MNPSRARTQEFHSHSRAQALVEFALIIPLALLLLTAIIEFGYAFYTWAAVGEVARIGTRYAVTGQYDPQYCPAAAAALSNAIATWPKLAAEDSADGAADCVIQSRVDEFEAKTAALQDWARIPSTHDAAMNGGAIGLLFNPGVSGNYIQFLSDPAELDGSQPNNGFKDDYRGDPTANGFISINICSNRVGVGLDTANPYYYNDLTASNDARYLGVCVVDNHYMDDAGGPGDRIRLTVTYNHPLIIPFFQALWPHLKLSTTQDAIVEKFRTARLSGLSSGISVLATWSPTPLPTNTPTQTPIPPTATPTATYTPTPLPCAVPGGNGLLARFYAYFGDQTTNAFTNLVYTRTDPEVNFNWGTNSPQPGSVPVDNFRVQWTGQVYPPYPGEYQFFTWSDDGVRLYIDGNLIINNWTNHGSTQNYSGNQNLSCGAHNIELEFYENTGNAVIRLGWQNGNFGEMLPIPQQYLFSPVVSPQPTSTYVTPTPTRTKTPAPTNTRRPPTSTHTPTVYVPPTHTFTPRPTTAATNTRVPSNTPVPTATFTPRPTCGISPDVGGCTPVP